MLYLLSRIDRVDKISYGYTPIARPVRGGRTMEKYAIVLTGGKQYKVQAESVIRVEKLDKEDAAVIELPVLMIADSEGNVRAGADVAKAFVKAEVVKSGKGKKINIFKYKSKKNVRKRQGHRQPFTELRVTEIVEA